MQVIRSFVEVHGKKQPHQTKVMIAMQVADEDVINL